MQNPGVDAESPAHQRVPRGWGKHKREDGRYKVSGADSESEQTRDEHLEVLADHSTDGQCCMTGREGGEVRPKRPTAGKVKPGPPASPKRSRWRAGITFLW